jgi:hypothetical protein
MNHVTEREELVDTPSAGHGEDLRTSPIATTACGRSSTTTSSSNNTTPP